MGALSRRKGASFELFIAAELRAVWPAARRGLGQPRGGAEAADVDGTPWWIQTKHGKRPNVAEAMRQAVRDAEAAHDDRPPAAITRANGADVLVTMRLSDWRNLAAAFESRGAAPCVWVRVGATPAAEAEDANAAGRGEP